MNKPLSIIVVRYCDLTIEIFSLDKKDRNVPHNGRNIGNYNDDYKYMCVACEGYYIKKIKQEDYNNLLNVCAENKFYSVCEDILPTACDNIITKLMEEVSEIKNNYHHNIFVHDYSCIEYDNINKNDCYIMYVHCEV